jgi:excisionase family DNA binding protein
MAGEKPKEQMSDTEDSGDKFHAERRTVSVEEAGRILGISRAAAYLYAKKGNLPTIRLGSRLLVPKAALDKLLTSA